ncbi:MAG: GNAT family N-acetyltransferase [Promethearchaeota archaeon]
MGDGVLIRNMTPSDIPIVRQIWTAVGFDMTKSDEISEVTRMLKHNPEFCLILELPLPSEKHIIGTVLGGFDGRRGWVHHLAILPEYGGKGYGKQLMTHLMQAFTQHGVVKFKLEIAGDKPRLIQFYQNMGWDLRSDLTTMSFTVKK